MTVHTSYWKLTANITETLKSTTTTHTKQIRISQTGEDSHGNVGNHLSSAIKISMPLSCSNEANISGNNLVSTSATKNQGCDDHKAVNGGGNEADYYHRNEANYGYGVEDSYTSG